MYLALILGFHTSSQISLGRQLERDLRSALSTVEFSSPDFKRVFDHTRAKYQQGIEKGGARLEWLPNYGPTPIRIAKMDLRLTRKLSDESFDEVTMALWPISGGTGAQFLDGFHELSEKDPSFLFWSETFRQGDRLIRCGRASREGSRCWPAARIYRLKEDRWTIVATEESNYIEEGTASFFRKKGNLVPNTIVASTRKMPDNISVPMAGPFLSYREPWHVGKNDIVREGAKLVQNPVAELDRLVGLALSNKRIAFDEAVPSTYQKGLWEVLRQNRRVFCEDGKGEMDCEIFTINDSELRVKATIYFAKRSGIWRIDRVSF